MIEARHYLSELKARLAASATIVAVEAVGERASTDRGYFRARLTLANGDFLEVSEYFVIQAGTATTLEYRYQWMDYARQKLIRRWDNAEHFPNLPHFPHHVHVGDQELVAPGSAMSIMALIDLIERELGGQTEHQP